MYLRKSSESEDKQKASIPAQERELLEFAQRRGLTVVGDPIRESMSAKKPGRPGFDEMLRLLQKKRAEGVLCWHLDRLARNPLDGGRVMQALGDGVIKEIATPGRSYSNSDDKLMMSIEFGMSTKYVDDLAKNVARGRREALQRGRWPSVAKLGYRRDRQVNAIVRDPERFDAVRQLWRWKLDGVPVAELVELAREHLHLCTPKHGRAGGKALTPSRIYAVLHDPFYAGFMRFKGETYKGKHDPMVTWGEFQQVQVMINPQAVRPSTHEFTYGGLMSCGRCGARVTAEETINRHGARYIYYHCCRKARRYNFCPERSVEERTLENQIERYLRELVIPQDLLRAVIDVIPEVLASADSQQAIARRTLQSQRDELDRRLERLRLLCADEVISVDEYVRDKEGILAARRSLESRQEATDLLALIEPLRQASECVNQAVLRFMSGTRDERRNILKLVSSNLTLRERTVHIEAKKPFAFLGQLRMAPELQATREDVRTRTKQLIASYLQKESHLL